MKLSTAGLRGDSDIKELLQEELPQINAPRSASRNDDPWARAEAPGPKPRSRLADVLAGIPPPALPPLHERKKISERSPSPIRRAADFVAMLRRTPQRADRESPAPPEKSRNPHLEREAATLMEFAQETNWQYREELKIFLGRFKSENNLLITEAELTSIQEQEEIAKQNQKINAQTQKITDQSRVINSLKSKARFVDRYEISQKDLYKVIHKLKVKSDQQEEKANEMERAHRDLAKQYWDLMNKYTKMTQAFSDKKAQSSQSVVAVQTERLLATHLTQENAKLADETSKRVKQEQEERNKDEVCSLQQTQAGEDTVATAEAQQRQMLKIP